MKTFNLIEFEPNLQTLYFLFDGYADGNVRNILYYFYSKNNLDQVRHDLYKKIFAAIRANPIVSDAFNNNYTMTNVNLDTMANVQAEIGALDVENNLPMDSIEVRNVFFDLAKERVLASNHNNIVSVWKVKSLFLGWQAFYQKKEMSRADVWTVSDDISLNEMYRSVATWLPKDLLVEVNKYTRNTLGLPMGYDTNEICEIAANIMGGPKMAAELAGTEYSSTYINFAKKGLEDNGWI